MPGRGRQSACVSPFRHTRSANKEVTTKQLTRECKNNLDGLTEDVDGNSRKTSETLTYARVGARSMPASEVVRLSLSITEANLDEPQYVKVATLETVISMIRAGNLKIPVH